MSRSSEASRVSSSSSDSISLTCKNIAIHPLRQTTLVNDFACCGGHQALITLFSLKAS